jgi:uncharacterized membrane protein (UPF0127 family)
MSEPATTPRLSRLATARVLGLEVPVARGFRARLLGLAGLDRADAGPGLLIPRCSSIHTFGMRFALDVFFLDEAGAIVAVRRGVGACRVANCRMASAVLEVPSEQGGEFSAAGP